MVSYLDMSIEGIFRKNGNIRRLKELTDALDRDPASVDLSSDNPVQLAALMKKFLRDMPDPLLTFKLHRLFIVSQCAHSLVYSVLSLLLIQSQIAFPTDAERRRYLHLVSLILPKSHRDTMEALFVFLKWVASFSHVDEETGSKMDLPNLATVICPSILYSKGRDAARDESFMAIRVVTLLLENQDDFFTVPDEFLPVLNDQEYFTNCMDLPCKDVLRKCETYLRVKQGRANGTNGQHTSIGNGSSARSDGSEVKLVHQQRSDPIMRGRPAPPFAEPEWSSGANKRRSPRSTSRGPGPSQLQSAHGHGSSPNLLEGSSGPPWTSGSPPSQGRQGLPTHQSAPWPVSRPQGSQNDSQSSPASLWDPRPSRPLSPRRRPSVDQSRSSPYGPSSPYASTPMVHLQQRP
jgi:RhoGAP domain